MKLKLHLHPANTGQLVISHEDTHAIAESDDPFDECYNDVQMFAKALYTIFFHPTRAVGLPSGSPCTSKNPGIYQTRGVGAVIRPAHYTEWKLLGVSVLLFVCSSSHLLLALICYTKFGSSGMTFDAHHMLPRVIETLTMTFHFAYL